MNISSDVDYGITWNIFTSNGNEDAFSMIYHGHYDLLYYVGLKYTSDIQVVEDSIQNVFVNLLKNRTKLNPVINVRGFLLKSFRRQLFLDLKKQKKFSLIGKVTEAQFDYFNGTKENLYGKDEPDELQRALKRSLLKLSDKQKEIIYLRYDCDLTYEEISDILEISVESCYQSVYRSIKTIKVDIEQMLKKGKNFVLWVMFHLRKSFC
jgi:RNA polymerase sigma factor (sigma-70 family)